ncbi:hypothetical protein QJS04_geneDACA010359 [Acorus gramineus]|uniref:Uncharacterized protein n=1 Tax=Acorus gramineus TaxID=55184 RepID=A0AAV9A4B6_ACOGR|nr:hypothetical protein QJS04_geneDACA010359 [Acorus gramineus]
MSASRYGECCGLFAKRVKWQRQRKGSVEEREVSIKFYIRDRFELKLKSSNGSLQHIVCNQKIERISTITRPLEELLNSKDLVKEVADMLLHTTYHQFMIFAKGISQFIHKEANALGPKYQMVRITAKFEEISMLNFDERFLLTKCTGFETVECNNLGVDEDACSICLETLMDSEKDEVGLKPPQ